jgi:purine-binding chemotaxis protein CheW
MKKAQGTPHPEQGVTIDWNEIHRRVEAAGEALAPREGTASLEEKRSILKARARALAREPEQAAAQEFLEIIEFRLGSETYGLESTFVGEVYPLKDFTPLPGTPPFVLGIVNVRGRILSVVNLKKFFNLPDKSLGQLNRLIILRNDQMEFGVLADAILGVRSIALNTLQVTPPTVSGIGAEYLRGVTGERVVVLDVEKILGDEKIIVHQ